MARLHNERERQEKESQERAADLLRLKVRETFYSACDCLEKEDTDTTDRLKVAVVPIETISEPCQTLKVAPF